MNDNENKDVVEQKEEKTISQAFDEVLSGNKEYQAEFDRRLAKANTSYLENEKVKWEKEYADKLAKEKTEAEKLAKMNTEQQLNYKIKQLEQAIADRDSQLNANSLKEATTNILIEKGIPSNYLQMFDFTKETADTINSKVELLNDIRAKDLQDSLNKSLRQEPPRYVNQEEDDIDPYIEGFNSEL